jgi:hypothetical protein
LTRIKITVFHVTEKDQNTQTFDSIFCIEIMVAKLKVLFAVPAKREPLVLVRSGLSSNFKITTALHAGK